MNNKILEILKESFVSYIINGSRSNRKLRILHSQIAKDIFNKLKQLKDKNDIYKVVSLDLKDGKEEKICGRYMDKTVDILIKKNDVNFAAVGVKFIMSNFKQNKNNYFENLLGEVANIRSANIPYYQILFIPEKLPYFSKNAGIIKKWETVTENDLIKYRILGKDNTKIYFHSPEKIFIGIIDFNYDNIDFKDYETFSTFFLDIKHNNKFSFSKIPSYDKNTQADSNLIINDYELFIQKVVFHILSI
ncbi:hypothetical protein ACXYRK_01735 [Mycoplasma sp. AC1221]